MLSEQPAVLTEEKDRAVAGAGFALDGADHDVAPVRRGRLPEALRMRPRNFDGSLEIDPKFLAPRRIARADDQTVAQSLRVSDDERLREDDDLRAGGGSIGDQPDGLVDTGIRVKRNRPGLDHGNLDRRLLRSHREMVTQEVASNARPLRGPQPALRSLNFASSPEKLKITPAPGCV